MRQRADMREPWTSKEIAEHLPCSADTVYNRLRELHSQGKVRTKKVGSRARVWWLPPSMDEQSDEGENQQEKAAGD